MGKVTLVVEVVEHELSHFKPCDSGDGGFQWSDGADRAVCSCGWASAASKNQVALVALFEIHAKSNLVELKG